LLVNICKYILNNMLFLNFIITKSKNKIKSTHLLKKSKSEETAEKFTLVLTCVFLKEYR
jgi:hypothetical protein